MKRFYAIFVAMLVGATSLFAQTNYKVTFSANVEMDKIQVKNLNSGATKTLAKSDKVITLQKNARQSGTPVESVEQSDFLQQTASNEVVVNMEKAGRLTLTLYSSNGTFVTRYANNVDAGPNAFQIGASSGVYVLVASANNQTASLKIMLTQSTQPSILEVLTDKPEPVLKSIDDVITFVDGDEFEFTGYYYSQTKVETLHSAFITSDKQIRFSFTKVTEPTVTTVAATNIQIDAAIVGGNVTSDNGTPVVERGVCWATTANPTVSNNKITSGTGTGTFSVTLSSLSDGTTYYVRAYAINSVGIAYGNTVTFTTVKKVAIVNGAIQKAFSVSATQKVYFSQGNLQCNPAAVKWRFAGKQYDIIGAANANVSSTYNGWIDLFGYGTSGYSVGEHKYLPYNTSRDYTDYPSQDIAGTVFDWGVGKPISNGGNQKGLWRTLTNDEWLYLYKKRAQAESLRGHGRVNNVNGYILLPDGWETPSSVTFTPNPKNYTTNVYSLAEWAIMEAYGAVFLPAAGYREGTTVSYVGEFGYYWSSTYSGIGNSMSIRESFMAAIFRDWVFFGDEKDISTGCSVRLVKDVK